MIEFFIVISLSRGAESGGSTGNNQKKRRGHMFGGEATPEGSDEDEGETEQDGVQSSGTGDGDADGPDGGEEDFTPAPSHESMVTTLESRDMQDPINLAAFGRHIRRTKIPKNHEEIVTAWRQACLNADMTDEGGLVEASILAQKPKDEAGAAPTDGQGE